MKQPQSRSQSIEQMLDYRLFFQRENQISHLPYEQEIIFYDAVKNGDYKKIKEVMLPLKNEMLGKLSDNPVRNLQYHLIITISMITRFCMEGGLPAEKAYTLSDLYIQQADKCTTEDELTQLHKKIVFEYALRMKRLQKKEVISLPVTRTMDYIYEHLQDKISLDEIAGYLDYNKTYLCDLFKKETGTTIAAYINHLKIEAAANMLIYTDYSAADISQYFAFSSHSHFINTFKKQMGVTPSQYQKLHYRKHFQKG